ncbi:hypothetical protein [Sphaerisporangium corydalis]|uniref:Glycosyltransferase RgtA/B/C/D-like domain-containing protein n=1 Tax=Sphaerisporangium corydalis TaxID=1441875 RepID=A0ABV9E7S8_9ACTN|nr:hypothetical protein [Sphaerisporangium corydalis]
MSRCLPAATALAVTVAVLLRYDVSPRDIILFTIYLLTCLTLPGTLLIRALHPAPRTLPEELALGLTLGYALEILTYLPARATGHPLLVLLWPAATYTAFLLHPRLRPHLTTRPTRTTPLPWAWSLSLAFTGVIAWGAVRFFRTNALRWPALGANDYDMPYHLALIGELKHHMPPAMPNVAGEPLSYHWFVYAHFAASSWITGVEPVTLLFRLTMLPILAAFVVLVGLTARRMTNSWASVAPAVAGTIFVGAPSLYLGHNDVLAWGGLQDVAWVSPTQTFGALVFAPVVLLLMDLFLPRRFGPGRWALLVVLLVTVMGSKATYLPLLATGLAAVAVTTALQRRRAPWRALVVLAMTLSCLAYAQFVLFGQARQGMVVAPLAFMRQGWAELSGVAPLSDTATRFTVPAGSLAGFTLLFLLCWAITWCGVLGLLARRRLLGRPSVVLMLGMGAAGHGAVLLFAHPGLSQFFFLFAAYPYLVIVTVYGITVITRRARMPARTTVWAVCAGLAAAYLVPLLAGVEVPLAPGRGDLPLYLPYLVLLAVAAAVAAVVAARGGALRAGAVVTTLMAAIALPACGHAHVISAAGKAARGGVDGVAPPVQDGSVPRATLAAARWLRDHSAEDDLVATNTHCRWGCEDPCDTQQLWMAALAERRMLVEGWAYTARNLAGWRPGEAIERLPFWDAERLRANDAVFTAPSARAVRVLRERYGVRWLLADRRLLHRPGRIGGVASLRFRVGDYSIYELPAAPGPGGDHGTKGSQ